MNKTLRLLVLILILGLGACALDEPSANRGLAVTDGSYLSELDSDQTALSLIKGREIMYYTGARQGTNGLWRTVNANDTLWEVPTYLAPADPDAGLAALWHDGQEFVVYANFDEIDGNTGLSILKFGNDTQGGKQEAVALKLGNGALLGRPICLIPPEGKIGNEIVPEACLGLAYADGEKLYLVSISIYDGPGSITSEEPKLIHTFKGELAGGGSLIPAETFGEDSPGGLLFARMTTGWDYDIFFSDLIGYEVKLPRVNSRRGERSPVIDPVKRHLYLASQAFAPESKFVSYNLFRWDLTQIGLKLKPQSYASSSSSSSEEATSSSSLASASSVSSTSSSSKSSSSSSTPTSSSSSSESSSGGATSINANLIARWEFDGDLNDSGNKYDGTWLKVGDYTGVPSYKDGQSGQSLSFPGGAVNGARVKVGNINLGRAFTICGWCRVEAPDHASKNMRLFSNRGDSGKSEGLDISINVWEDVLGAPDTLTEDGDRRISVTYYKTGGYGGEDQASDITTPENEEFVIYSTWSYLAVSVDLDESKVAIYFNEKSYTDVLKYNDFRLDRPFYIGGAHNSFNSGLDNEGDDSGTYFYKGLLDDVRIYDRALTAEEIGWLRTH